MKFALGLVAALAVVAGTAVAQSVEDQIAERIAPVDKSCMAGEACAAAAPVAAAGGGARSGEDIYKKSCVTCHGTGAAGAPKFGDAGSWAPRIAKGIDTLYTHALNGFNAMPAKGLCMDCSDDEVKASVDYMVEGSK